MSGCEGLDPEKRHIERITQPKIIPMNILAQNAVSLTALTLIVCHFTNLLGVIQLYALIPIV